MMALQFKQRISFSALALLIWSITSQLFALNCYEVNQLTQVYFKMHFSQHEFSDELSQRTLDNFIKQWDPGKVYFLKADIDSLNAAYATNLDDMIKKGDCSALDKVLDVYSKRFEERQAYIMKQIDAKQDFTVDEYMTIDRKKLDFAATQEEVNERWRQRIKFQLLQMKKTLSDLGKAQDKLKKRYQLAAKRHNELKTDDVYAIFLNSFSNALDPHSDYMSAEQLEDFRIQTRLSLEGIGAVLRSEDGFTTIQSLVPGGAAAKTGKIKVDDKIIAVAQGNETPVDVIDMDLREVVKLIRGARATEVKLTLVRDEEGKAKQFVVPVVREKIQLADRAAKSKLYTAQVEEDGGKKSDYKIGVIVLPSFYMDFEGRQARKSNFTSSSADVLREINKLKAKGVDSIIMDLRNNGGGSLDEAINLAGLFIDKGPVVQIKQMDGSTYVQKDKDGYVSYDGPLLVMINRQSASASEIFAGAIKDYERGLIVGDDHTFGKGTVQNLNDITEKLGAVKVTVSKFYRPSGASTQLKGVESDIAFPSLFTEYEIGEKYYDYALPWEQIQKSSYKGLGMVAPYVDKLKAASQSRIKDDAGFKKISDDIAEFKKNEVERNRVSLKEEKEPAAKDAKVADVKADKKGKDKKKKDEDSEDEQELSLDDDIHLQETLKVAADYLQLTKAKNLAKVTLPDLKPVVVADTKKADGAAKKPAQEVEGGNVQKAATTTK